MEKAAERILQWKAHIVRAINQEKNKIDVLDNLTEEQVLVVMDWTMKWLPQSHRETQKEWFGKKGISWHVSACITKVEKDETEFQVFTVLRVQIRFLMFSMLLVFINIYLFLLRRCRRLSTFSKSAIKIGLQSVQCWNALYINFCKSPQISKIFF